MSEHEHFEGVEYSTINDDVVKSLTTATWKYWVALAITGSMVIFGGLLYYYQTTVGLSVWAANEPVYWGLDLPTFIFWIGFSLSGTLLSAILLLTKSHWRNPIFRAAEISTGIALIVAQVVILTHLGRPWRSWYTMPLPNFRFMWPNFRSPLQLDILGMIAYLTASMTFLFVGAIPDFAALRDRITGWRKTMYTILSFGWKGSAGQWRHFRRAYLMIACFIIPIAIAMHTVTSWVPSMTNNPASRSTIFPFYFVTGALLSGVSGVIMILIIIRRVKSLQKYLKIKYYDHLAKLVLVASLGITYIYLVELFIPWYKPGNFELMPLAAKIYGRYSLLFWIMVLLNSVIPLSMFMRKVRQNLTALFFISVGIQIAMYFERVLMIIPSLSMGYMPAQWISYFPNPFELALLFWEINIFIFVYLLISKIVPVISIFEVKELLPLPKRGAKAKSATAITGAQATNAQSGKPLLGTFKFIDDVTTAIEQLKRAGYKKIEAHTPVPSEEIDTLLAPKPTGLTLNPKVLLEKLRNRDIHVVRFSAAGAIGGVAIAFALGIGTMLLYPIKTGPFSITPLPPVVFMAGVFASLIGLLVSAASIFILGRMPKFKLTHYDEGSSDDTFTIVVNDIGTKGSQSVKKIMENCGAEKIVEGKNA